MQVKQFISALRSVKSKISKYAGQDHFNLNCEITDNTLTIKHYSGLTFTAPVESKCHSIYSFDISIEAILKLVNQFKDNLFEDFTYSLKEPEDEYDLGCLQLFNSNLNLEYGLHIYNVDKLSSSESSVETKELLKTLVNVDEFSFNLIKKIIKSGDAKLFLVFQPDTDKYLVFGYKGYTLVTYERSLTFEDLDGSEVYLDLSTNKASLPFNLCSEFSISVEIDFSEKVYVCKDLYGNKQIVEEDSSILNQYLKNTHPHLKQTTKITDLNSNEFKRFKKGSEIPTLEDPSMVVVKRQEGNLVVNNFIILEEVVLESNNIYYYKDTIKDFFKLLSPSLLKKDSCLEISSGQLSVSSRGDSVIADVLIYKFQGVKYIPFPCLKS